MILKQYYLGCLAHASYLVGDEDSGVAVVIDPQRDVDEYVKDASAHGLRIEHVILTHFHADFLAGHLELRDRTKAAIYLGAGAEAEYPFIPLGTGQGIELGTVRLEALETPGHTPEGISILVFDQKVSEDKPHAVMTGDTLFVGDVGRPDLMASVGVTAEELGGMLYESLHDKLMKLPDETLVYPAHGAGSMCGKNLSDETVSTIGDQRKLNYALQPMTKEKFISIVAAEQPEAPAYFAYDANLNRKERVVLEDSLRTGLKALSLEEVLRQRNIGVQIVDTRDPAAFESRYLIDSVNIGLGGQYATWAGSLLDTATPIVLIAEPGREHESAMRLGRIGFDRVAGYLEAGIDSVAHRTDLLGVTERVDSRTLSERLIEPEPPLVLDVRAATEHAAGTIEGAVNMPLPHLRERSQELPRDRRIVVVCASGYRSAIAASLLKGLGFDRVSDLIGGFNGWTVALGTAAAAGAS